MDDACGTDADFGELALKYWQGLYKGLQNEGSASGMVKSEMCPPCLYQWKGEGECAFHGVRVSLRSYNQRDAQYPHEGEDIYLVGHKRALIYQPLADRQGTYYHLIHRPSQNHDGWGLLRRSRWKPIRPRLHRWDLQW